VLDANNQKVTSFYTTDSSPEPPCIFDLYKVHLYEPTFENGIMLMTFDTEGVVNDFCRNIEGDSILFKEDLAIGQMSRTVTTTQISEEYDVS
jgi:hypothetical protein